MALRDSIRSSMIRFRRQLTFVRLWPMTARAYAALARVFVAERLWDVPPRRAAPRTAVPDVQPLEGRST
jgi:hypothetical protein